MIVGIVKYIYCKIKEHNFIDAGKCPFTGNQYKMCTRCQQMVVA